jgi:acyl carrier protein
MLFSISTVYGEATMPMTKDEVFTKVKEVLTTALAVDDDEVTPEAKLSEDLGAESIDYLDITFQLEKSFGIKIPKGELIPENMFTNPEFVQNGKMTPKGVAELKTRMPFADISAFEADPDINKFRDIFTVDTLVRYVMTKVNS